MLEKLLTVLGLVSLLSANPFAGVIKDVSPVTGRAVPPVSWKDENGKDHRLSEFAGYPVLLLPIYTRCRTACPTNVERLKAALATASTDSTRFRVLLFSFDPTDTPAVLTNYRASQKIPLGWSVGTGSMPDTEALLESIGFQVGQAGREFTHPNMLVFLDANLRVAKWIYGDLYSGGDIDAALKVANGGSDWIGQHADVLYALLLFAASLLCVVLCFSVLQLVNLRRVRRIPASDES